MNTEDNRTWYHSGLLNKMCNQSKLIPSNIHINHTWRDRSIQILIITKKWERVLNIDTDNEKQNTGKFETHIICNAANGELYKVTMYILITVKSCCMCVCVNEFTF